MARRVIQSEEFTDDLDGSSAAETVRFAFDGQSYEIDLSRSNKRAFEKLMKPYVQNARKARGGRTGGRSSARSTGRGRTSGGAGSGRSSSAGGRDLAAVRAWANEQGMAVSERGRLSKNVLEAYDAAHS
jgi:hypothetical protein